MENKTLETILDYERKHRHEDGAFGIRACKESIVSETEWSGKSLFQLLGEYAARASEDRFFNRAMILACWELINEVAR